MCNLKEDLVFNKLIKNCPKITPQFITNRIVYAARNTKDKPNAIIFKFNKREWIKLNKDGTWETIISKGHKTAMQIKEGKL